MEKAGREDPAIEKRVRHLQHRTVEELYDLSVDPDCRQNLLGHGDYHKQLADLRGQLFDWMTQTDDSVLSAFRNRDDVDALEAFMKSYSMQAKHEMEARRLYEEGTGYRF
jgi:hypothetical protein